jgi:hypothetical protein
LRTVEFIFGCDKSISIEIKECFTTFNHIFIFLYILTIFEGW